MRKLTKKFLSQKSEAVIWRFWVSNWENAKRFFESKGNIKTRAKLKAKWYKDFEKTINQ